MRVEPAATAANLQHVWERWFLCRCQKPEKLIYLLCVSVSARLLPEYWFTVVHRWSRWQPQAHHTASACLNGVHIIRHQCCWQRHATGNNQVNRREGNFELFSVLNYHHPISRSEYSRHAKNTIREFRNHRTHHIWILFRALTMAQW